NLTRRSVQLSRRLRFDWRWFFFLLHFGEQGINIPFQIAVHRSIVVFPLNDAFFVQNVNCWPAVHMPFLGDWPVLAIPKGRPRKLLILCYFLRLVTVTITVDTQKGELLVGELLDKGFLFREHRTTRRAPRSPEDNHNHFAAVV